MQKRILNIKLLQTPIESSSQDGSIKRYKARLVAKGFTQTYGIIYLETFALVAKLNRGRVLPSRASNLNFNPANSS